MDVGQLLASLGLDATAFQTGLNQATSAAQRAGRAITSALSGSSLGGANLNPLREGLRGATQETKNLKFGLKDTQRVLFGILEARVFNTVLREINDAASALVDFNAELEQSQISFKYLLKDAEAAKSFTQILQDIAAYTPFTVESATKTAQQLLAMGVSAKEVTGVLQIMSDAVSAAGGSEVTFERIGYAMGQIKASSKLLTQDVRQLINAGIPAWEILREELGMTQEELNKAVKSGLNSEAAYYALLDGMQKRYAGASAEQAKTWNGLKSTLGDLGLQIGNMFVTGGMTNMKNVLGELVDKLSVINEIGKQHGAGGILEQVFGKSGANQIRALLGSLRELARAFVMLYQALGPVREALTEGLIRGITISAMALSALVKVVATLCQALAPAAPLIMAVTTALVVLKVALAVTSLVKAFTAAVGGLSICSVASAAVSMLATAFGYLSVASSPVLATIIMVAGAIAVLAGGVKLLTSLFDSLTEAVAKFTQVDYSDIYQDENVKDYKKQWDDYLSSLQDGTEGVGDAADDANSSIKKFAASFDELFQVKEDTGNLDDLAKKFDLKLPETDLPEWKFDPDDKDDDDKKEPFDPNKGIIPPRWPSTPPPNPPSGLPKDYWDSLSDAEKTARARVQFEYPESSEVAEGIGKSLEGNVPVEIPIEFPYEFPDFLHMTQPLEFPIEFPYEFPSFDQLLHVLEMPIEFPYELPDLQSIWELEMPASLHEIVEFDLPSFEEVKTAVAGLLEKIKAGIKVAISIDESQVKAVQQEIMQLQQMWNNMFKKPEEQVQSSTLPKLVSRPSSETGVAKQAAQTSSAMPNLVSRPSADTGVIKKADKKGTDFSLEELKKSKAADFTKEQLSQMSSYYFKNETSIKRYTTSMGKYMDQYKRLLEEAGTLQKGNFFQENGLEFIPTAIDGVTQSYKDLDVVVSKFQATRQDTMGIFKDWRDSPLKSIANQTAIAFTDVGSALLFIGTAGQSAAPQMAALGAQTTMSASEMNSLATASAKYAAPAVEEVTGKVIQFAPKIAKGTAAAAAFAASSQLAAAELDGTGASIDLVGGKTDWLSSNMMNLGTSALTNTANINDAFTGMSSNTSSTVTNMSGQLTNLAGSATTNGNAVGTALEGVGTSASTMQNGVSVATSGVNTSVSNCAGTVATQLGVINTKTGDAKGAFSDLSTGVDGAMTDADKAVATKSKSMQGVLESLKKSFNEAAKSISTWWGSFTSGLKEWWNSLFGKDNSDKEKSGAAAAAAGQPRINIPQYASGGIISRDSIIRAGEGNKREAVVPLENSGAMDPFADAVANRIMTRMPSSNSSSDNNEKPVIYVEHLIADDRGLRELYRKFEVIEQEEKGRKGR